MEVLFHFIFELIKISILGCIYATLTLLTFKIIGHCVNLRKYADTVFNSQFLTIFAPYFNAIM
jgi:hypothetical protein